jgi:hypothetical protein
LFCRECIWQVTVSPYIVDKLGNEGQVEVCWIGERRQLTFDFDLALRELKFALLLVAQSPFRRSTSAKCFPRCRLDNAVLAIEYAEYEEIILLTVSIGDVDLAGLIACIRSIDIPGAL